jgi:hypothetical protein
MRVYVLQIVGAWVVFWVCDLDRIDVGSSFLGYDPAFGKFSPGMVLIASLIGALNSGTGQRASAVDFGLGDTQYKEVLATTKWIEGNSAVFFAILARPMVKVDGYSVENHRGLGKRAVASNRSTF